MRGIPVPSRGSMHEGVLYEMIRHERFIEADKWELIASIAASFLAGKKWDEARQFASVIRRDLMGSLNHITPSLDYTIAKARAQLRARKEGDPRADVVASWTDESPLPTAPEKKK